MIPKKQQKVTYFMHGLVRAYDMMLSHKRNGSGKIGNTKTNRWKQSSAQFFNSLAKQAKNWIDGNSTYPNPWSYK